MQRRPVCEVSGVVRLTCCGDSTIAPSLESVQPALVQAPSPQPNISTATSVPPHDPLSKSVSINQQQFEELKSLLANSQRKPKSPNAQPLTSGLQYWLQKELEASAELLAERRRPINQYDSNMEHGQYETESSPAESLIIDSTASYSAGVNAAHISPPRSTNLDDWLEAVRQRLRNKLADPSDSLGGQTSLLRSEYVQRIITR